MMLLFGCTHRLLPTKRVTDDTESVGGGRSNPKRLLQKRKYEQENFQIKIPKRKEKKMQIPERKNINTINKISERKI